MSWPVTDDFVRAYVARSLAMDCPKIVLRQGKEENPRILEGPGLISQDDDGAFQLRMYPRDVSIMDGWQMLVGDGVTVRPGVLVPPEAFYTLEATDVHGQTWSCPRVSLRSSSTGEGGTVIRAKIDSLETHELGAKSSVNYLRLILPQEIKLAWNRTTEDTLRSGDQKLQRKVERARAEFTVGNLSFAIQKSDDGGPNTSVTVRSSQPLPLAIEWRVQEALRFITFRGVAWGIAQTVTGGERRVHMVPPVEAPGSILWPPLDATDDAEAYWRLFGCYLQYVCRHEDAQTFHPLSGNLNAILTAQHPPIDILALLLGVTVEGVLSTEFPALGDPSADFLSALARARRAFDDMPCEHPRLKARIEGALRAMETARVKDKLHALKERGALDDTLCQAWEKLRNSAAHAVRLDPLALQAHVTRCNEVYELLLTLIYRAIGYEGIYRRYSVEGWPLSQFPPTSEEAGNARA